MNKTFEEIRKDYTIRYPHLAHLKRDRDFARAALVLAMPGVTTMHDLVVLCRVAGSPALDDTDTCDDLVAFGKDNGYFDED